MIFNDEKSSIAEAVDANEANGAALGGTTASEEGEATEEREHGDKESTQDQVIKAATTVAEQDARERALESEEGVKPPKKKKMTPEEVKARIELRQMDDILPCLTLVPLHKLSLLTILELLRMQGGGGVVNGVKTTAALITIGKAVENEYKMEVCRQAKIPITMNTAKGTNYFTRMGYNHLHERRIAAARSQERDEKWQADWSQALRAKVGAFLVNSLQSLATVSRTKVDPKTGELLYVLHLSIGYCST